VIAETREDHNDGLDLEGIVVNQFQSRAKLPTQLVQELKAEGQPVLPVYLNNSIKMRESHQSCTPLIHLAPSHPMTQKFVELYECLSSEKKESKLPSPKLLNVRTLEIRVDVTHISTH